MQSLSQGIREREFILAAFVVRAVVRSLTDTWGDRPVTTDEFNRIEHHLVGPIDDVLNVPASRASQFVTCDHSDCMFFVLNDGA